MSDLSVLERFFQSLVASNLIDPDRWEWGGEFGNATCPVCEQRNFLYFTGDGWKFKFGCREMCDRTEILQSLALDRSDMMPVQPKWLRKV